EDRNKAVNLNPLLPEVWVARGGSYHQLGQHELGLADRSEAIRLSPTHAPAWLARGSAYFLLERFDKAAADLKEAVRLDPASTEARELLARAEVADRNRK